MVVPAIFLDIDLLLDLVERYDPITHEIKDVDGNVLLKIDIDSIRKAFNLHLADEVTDSVDFKILDEAFNHAEVDRQ